MHILHPKSVTIPYISVFFFLSVLCGGAGVREGVVVRGRGVGGERSSILLLMISVFIVYKVPFTWDRVKLVGRKIYFRRR